jgi:hypothetical protein
MSTMPVQTAADAINCAQCSFALAGLKKLLGVDDNAPMVRHRGANSLTCLKRNSADHSDEAARSIAA